MLENFPIHMTPFHEDRMIRVYLPKDYHEGDKRYPVLYMHDGKNVFLDEDAIGGVSLGLADFLDERGYEVIVVGIDASMDRNGRVDEYCPWPSGEYSKKFLGEDRPPLGGKGEAYVEYIVHELKPLIDEKYRTLEDRTYMAGVSVGGLIATYAACRYPQVFRRIAAISNGYYRNKEEMEHLARNSDLSSIERFYMDCGTNEGGDLCQENVALHEAMYEILKGKVSDLKFVIAEGGEHKYPHFRSRVPEIFSYLLGE